MGLLGAKAAPVLVFCRVSTLLSIAAAVFAFPPTVHAGVLLKSPQRAEEGMGVPAKPGPPQPLRPSQKPNPLLPANKDTTGC